MLDFIRKLMVLARPYRGRLVLGIFFGILSGLSQPALTVVISLAISVIFPSADAVSPLEKIKDAPPWLQSIIHHISGWLPAMDSPETVSGIILVISLIPLVMLLRGVFTYLNHYLMQWVGIRAVNDLRKNLFRHLLYQSMSFFHKGSTGEMMSRVFNDTTTIQTMFSTSLSVIFRDPVQVLSLAAVLLYRYPGMTSVTLLVLPVCLAPIIIYTRKVRKASKAMQSCFAELTNQMHESFTGQRIIKAYNLEETVVDRFYRKSGEVVRQFMRIARSSEIPGPFIEFMAAVGISIILFYLKVIAHSKMTADEFTQFVLSVYLMYQPIKALSKLYAQMEQARAATFRIYELMETRSEIVEPAQPVSLQANRAEIHFDGVDFDYGEKPVLRDIQLKIQPGQQVALVGASGSGKSTITHLLLRFYDPIKGSIKIGNIDLRQASLRDLRNQMAIVTQETILFNDTILNNILLGRPGATRSEVEAAARQAHAHEFIMEKPQGYDSLIGEKGLLLSGGQRQRLAIARAILKNAPILILDEATSALDTESERAVQDALDELMVGRTSLCIAHRLSTIFKADMIVVLDQGRIVETGRHEELLSKNGHYSKLYQLQFKV
jgi:subfamily B ATP-binding cassette protein MsbA